MRVIHNQDTPQTADRLLLFHPPVDAPLDMAVASARHAFSSLNRIQEPDRPRLLVFRMSEPAISLGVFQDPQTALDSSASFQVPVVQRLSGGPATWMGAGSYYVVLVLPNWPALFNHVETPKLTKNLMEIFISAMRKINLSLTMSPCEAIIKKGLEVGRITFNLHRKNLLMEFSLGIREPLALAPGLNGYPSLSTEACVRKPGCLQDIPEIREMPVFGESFARAMAEILFHDRHRFQESEFSWLEKTRIENLRSRTQVPVTPESLPVPDVLSSRPFEDHIGFVHARVTLSPAFQLNSVRFFGDFIADSGGILELEKRLRHCELQRHAIAKTIDDVLGSPEHIVFGLKRLATFLDAILDAASRHPDWDPSGA